MTAPTPFQAIRETLNIPEARVDVSVLPGDELARIERERAAAMLQLGQAERDMLDRAATDRDGFAEARARQEAAKLTIDQLLWAEKAEHQRREQAERAAKMAKLRQVQDAARAAHERATGLAGDLRRIVEDLAATIRALRDCQAEVEKGMHHEVFAVNAGEISKGTVRRLVLDPDNAVMALRAAKEYLKLAQVSEQLADMRASQGKL